MKSKRIILALCLVFVLIMATTAFAQTPLTFTNGGNNFIYADSPEAFSLGSDSLIYQYGAGLGTSYKDVEYYYWLYNKNAGYDACRVGIAVQNTTGSSVTITYKGKSNNVAVASGGQDDGLALSYTPAVLRDFENATYQTITVPAYSSVIVTNLNNNFSFSPNYLRFAYGRAQLKSSVSSGVYVRVFAAGQSKTAAQVFAASPTPGDGSHFCGELSYTQKNATLDALNIDSYKIFEWQRDQYGNLINKNTAEYTTVLSYKSGSISQHAGNYGVIYNLTINNAAGKKIKIIPNWAAASKACIVYSLNGSAWTVPAVINNGGMYYWSLGTNSTANVKLILPGGNYGNFDISFE